MGRSPLTKEKLQELAGKLGLYVVEKPATTEAAPAASEATGSDLIAFLAERGLDSVEAIEAAITKPPVIVSMDEGVTITHHGELSPPLLVQDGDDDPPPSLTLRANVNRDFSAVLKLFKAGYLSHEEWRVWELWQERNQ